MGISGLLPFIKNSCRSANVRDFSGATVAVDAYSWLHKGAFSCAEKLVKGEKTDGYVHYCLKLLNMLLDAGVKPIMVFDGCNLSSKAITEKKRRENRERTRQKGKELLCEGKIKEARECFQRCVDVTPEMAREVIEMCRKKSIEYIVAPYEADAQLAYLNKIGVAQIVITEDSDLVVFGCDKILFKMDHCGGGLLYEKENLSKSFGANAAKFSFEKFRYMCILSGCDYLPSLPGIGLAKACKFFMLTNNLDLTIVLSKLPSYLKMPKLSVPEEYKESYVKANNTFLHQLVFCPKKKSLVPLNTYPEGLSWDDMEYAGKYLPDKLALQIAMGDINVKTLKMFEDINDASVDENKSILWGTKEASFESKAAPKKEISAFKFSSTKTKSIPVKRKHEETNSPTHELKPIIDEELFSMYGVTKQHEEVFELSDEDPIQPEKRTKASFSPIGASKVNVASPKSHSTFGSLQRIVKSRFFVKEASEKKSSSSVLKDLSLENLEQNVQEDDPVSISSINSDFMPEQNDEGLSEPMSCSLHLPSPKKNKENIIHRFAKKKLPDSKIDKDSESSAALNINSKLVNISPQKSCLDVIDHETYVNSSTDSTKSCGRASEMLCENSKTFKDNIKDKSIAKTKKCKLIDTNILNFKWSKNPSCQNRLNDSLGSSGYSSFELVSENDDAEKEKSPYFFTALKNNDETESSLEERSSHQRDAESTLHSQSQGNSSKAFLSVKPKPVNLKNFGKANKCRQIGLSKNRKKECKISKKETLLNFNFIRKPKSVEVLV